MERVRKRKSAADRKLEIIETTIRLAGDIGPDRVTTQHLADAVGLTQPAIFRHFATKTDIWNAVGEYLASAANDDARKAAAERAEAAPNAHEALENTLQDQIDYMAANPAVCYITASRELLADNEKLRKTLAAMLEKRHADLTTLIEKAKAEGVHGTFVQPADAAHLILSALHGLAMRWSLDGMNFDFAAEAQRLITNITDTMRA